MKYFKIEEFDSPDRKGSGKNMQQNVLNQLDMARMAAGTPFIINSGYRTKEHNATLKHSTPTSSHLDGWAVDIHCIDSASRERIVYGLIMAGFQRIGIAKTFIHTDLDPYKNPAIWLY